MPLHGKIVVIKRSGGDGTEFPLTATCLFGRKPDCDIRIQLPQVSKEHCRIDFNENKEIILTNLSSVNPTRVNGEALQQSERLKHGDVITVIDRSFRFEYPPAPTPKKRSSIGGKTKTFKVLQNQQVGDAPSTELGEKRISEVSTDPHLKDGTNHENIQRPLEKTVEVKEEDGLLQSKTASPFNDLYQMIKKSLDVKTPRKSSASVLQTPSSKFCTPQKPVIYTEDKITPKDEAEVSSIADETMEEAVKKQGTSFQVPPTEMAIPEAENADQSEVTSPQKRSRTPPQRFSPCEVVEQISATPKSPVRRASPRNSGKVETVKEMSKKRKREELSNDLPTSQMKRKRVSFGGFLCPELFDKRLPPDSPLCKGATPRRSVSDAKQSLLRRTSAIGLLQGKKGSKNASPKSRSPSPKAATPVKKSPSPSRGRSPTVQGRFSVSQISTPSPIADDGVTEQVFVTATPLRRRSTSWETPSQAKSAVKVLRRSGISRASMKVKNSWADIVRFGQTKAQVAAPAKKTVAKKTIKTVSKPQTPARNLKGHVTTGHADSPVTIVVGRAHKQTVVHPTGAAPKLVNNIALLQKHMKMDEDLTGISEMLKTPGNEGTKTSVIDQNNAPKTQVGGLGTSVAEPSVLNTPEETGEMMVSPLTVSSTIKDRSYNSEAVQRLFDNDQESSIVSDGPAVDDSSEQKNTDLKTTSVTTPKQKPQLPECLTGVKRIMKTPRQKAEPIEDLRGKILKTPKQKPEKQECLTGVKRMMTTPRQEDEPVEDIKVELLTTPKQKPEQECLTEVERVCNTPQLEAELKEPLEAPKALEAGTAPAHMQEPEDLSEKRDMPAENVKSSPLVCLTEGKRVSKTPKKKSAPVEDMVGLKRLMKTPKEKGEPVEENFGITRLVKTPRLSSSAPVEQLTEPSVQPEINEVADHAPLDCDEDIAKELFFAHEEPQDDVPTDVVNDVPQVDIEMEADANEVVVDDRLKLSEDKPDVEAAMIKVTEMDTTATEPDNEKPVESLVADAAEDCDAAVVPTPVKRRREKKTEATAPPSVRQTTRGRNAKSQGSPSDDQPEMAPEKALESAPVTEISTEAESDQTSPIAENDSAPTEEEAVTKPPRGRKTKQTPVKPPQPEPELNEVVGAESLPAEKPRRGRKPKPDTVEQTEVAEDAVVAVETKQQPPVRAKRGRNAKQEEEKLESASVETTKSQEPAKKLRRTKKAEQSQASEEQAEIVPEPESQQSPPVDVSHEASDSVAPLEKSAVKPKRGRKAKQPEKSAMEQQDVPSSQNEDVPQADMTKAEESEVCSVAHRSDKNKSSAAMETAPQAPVTESLPEVVTEMDAAVPKKSGRGRRAKLMEFNLAEDKQETADDAVVPTPVRGRRGKKTEATAPPAENDSAPTEEEAVAKPARGRQTKPTPVKPPQPEPELNEVVGAESLPAEKPRRGRKPKPVTVEQTEVAEDAVVTVETKQQPLVRAKRGRNAKQEEEKLESASVETTKSQEPAKKLRRSKKAEQSHGEPSDVQAIEMVVPEEAEAPQAAKPRRGCKTTEVQEVPAVNATDGLEKNSEPEAPVMKQSRARGAKTSVKNEVSQAIPVKKARRGAALPLEETNAESTVQVSEPTSTSVEPAKRGRRAAAKPPAIDATVAAEDLSGGPVEDTKTFKRSVKGKAVFEIPQVTPVKAVRGKKSKLGGQVDAESNNVPKAADKTEEMDLSDKVVEAQPIKRTRKGPKVADVTASTSKVKSIEAEAQLKTRRGRSAKE
ncbi:proliferation marker protein Ki-67 isoform X2 [Cyclopterus lumpus]|uniref:proliferation marker protein Ki-67 isoform X2 n=1 Tax=Cyclopterus lumpus TaxID=8103 RepID=UPI0014862120|nr:proliferation marker protein Ki-67 isoform X2 [Cyclopterus lumpus]